MDLVRAELGREENKMERSLLNEWKHQTDSLRHEFHSFHCPDLLRHGSNEAGRGRECAQITS